MSLSPPTGSTTADVKSIHIEIPGIKVSSEAGNATKDWGTTKNNRKRNSTIDYFDDDDNAAPIAAYMLNDGNVEAAAEALFAVYTAGSGGGGGGNDNTNNDSTSFPSPISPVFGNGGGGSGGTTTTTTTTTTADGDEDAETHTHRQFVRLTRAVYGQLSSYQRMDLFRALDVRVRFGTFQYLRPSEQGLVIEECTTEDAEACIASIPPSHRLDTLQRLNFGAVEKIQHVLSPEEKAACDLVQSYPINSVGRSMSALPPGMALRGSLTVSEALAVMSAKGAHSCDPNNTLGMIFVRNAENQLLGYTYLQALLQAQTLANTVSIITAKPTSTTTTTTADTTTHTTTTTATTSTDDGGSDAAAAAQAVNTALSSESATSSHASESPVHVVTTTTTTTTTPSSPSSKAGQSTVASSSSSSSSATTPCSMLMQDICQPFPFLLKTTDLLEEATRLFTTQTVAVLPVISGEDGTLFGIMRSKDAIMAVNNRLHAALAAAAAETGITSYSKASVLFLVRKRIVWLFVLAAINFGVAAIVGGFEEVLAQNLVLAGFIPLLAGMGGNIGAQASALIISAVSSRDISPRDWRRVCEKEFRVSFVLALILGLVVAIMGYVRGKTGELALVIGASMGVVALFANMLGTVLPFLSLATGTDPAVSSSPLITTVIDVLGITIYLAFAMIILGLHA